MLWKPLIKVPVRHDLFFLLVHFTDSDPALDPPPKQGQIKNEVFTGILENRSKTFEAFL
jgi:hypothetical protein